LNGDFEIKVLIVNTSDALGGAHIAANRIHQSLLLKNIDSKMLVKTKRTHSPSVIEVPQKRIKRIYRNFLHKIENYFLHFYKNRSRTLFSVAFFSFPQLIKEIEKIDPDIVHLNWISNGFIKIEDFCKIKKPIVWTLHDMWAFTGGCHLNEGCENFILKCGNCKILGSKHVLDLSRFNFNRKIKIYKKIDNLKIVTVSNWLKNLTKKSKLLKNFDITTIPNTIDSKLFRPISKNSAREIWNLPQNKKLILFGALNSISNKNKGFSLLLKALNKIKNFDDIELVLIENQISPIANRMKTVQGMLSQYFLMKNDFLDVEFISSSNKLKDEELHDSYAQRKKAGITKCLGMISESFTSWVDFFNHHKKKDDLADCFLQGMWYIKNKM